MREPEHEPPKVPGVEPDSRRRLPWALLAWFVALPVWLTWTPFVFEGSRPPPHLPMNPLDVVGNVLLLLPLGMACAHLARRHRLWWAGLAAMALSGALEAGQLFLPSRVSSPLDIALNTAGALLGAHAAVALGGLHTRRLLRWGGLVTYVAVLAQVGYTAAVLRREFVLEGWDPDYPIAAGDEIAVDRRYQGEVTDAFICAGREAPVCAGPGGEWEVRRALTRLAEQTQHVEAGATVRSTSDTQNGPTRIVTFSRGAYERNLTLGQKGTALVVRVRTPLTGPNGTGLELLIPDAIRAGPPVAVRVSLDARTLTVEITGQGETRRWEHTVDAFNAGVLFASLRTITPLEGIRVRLATLALTLFPLLALLVGALPRGRHTVEEGR